MALYISISGNPQQRVAAAGGIANAKARAWHLIQAARSSRGTLAPLCPFQRSAKLLDEECLRFAVHFHQQSALLIFLALFG